MSSDQIKLYSSGSLVSAATIMDGAVISAYGGNDSMFVSSGGTANNTLLDHMGFLIVSSGGTADSTNIVNMGFLTVSDGGTANSTTISNMGSLTVSSGGTANSTIVNNMGFLTVSSGGTANSTIVNDMGGLTVSSGGTANSTIVNNMGFLTVSSGGTANSTTINSGHLSIACSGIANDNTIDSMSDMTVWDGGIANRTFINGICTFLDVSSGGTANSTTISNSGYMRVSSGGTANSTTISNSGDMWVLSEGTANNTTVNAGGLLRVCSGGTAVALRENGGCVYVENGANVSFLSNTLDGLILSSASATLHSGTTANSTTVNSGNLNVLSGGIANNTDVIFWGYMNISSGGTANNTTVNSGGSLHIASGGTASNTTVNSEGALHIASGGTASNTTVNWVLRIASGGTASNTTVNSGGVLRIASGGTAVALKENGGYVDVEDNANVTFLSNTLDGLLLSNDSATLHSGTTANSTNVSLGYLHVCSGGTANNTNVVSGCLYVSSGGTANSTTISNFGYMLVSSEGTANSSIIKNTGSLTVSCGGTANNTNVCSFGFLIIQSGGTANNTEVLNHGYMNIYSGGTANSTAVSSDGCVWVVSGGFADNISVNAFGNLSFDGGTAENIVWTPCVGDVRVYSGSATFASSYSGCYYGDGERLIVSAPLLSSMQLGCQRDRLCVFTGGTASHISAAYGTILVYSGGVISDTTLGDWGYMTLFSGTSGKQIVNGGVLEVWDASLLDITTVSGGEIFVYDKGIIGGKIQVQDGGQVRIYEGSFLDFTVSEQTDSSTALVNDFSRISWLKEESYPEDPVTTDPLCTITVQANQAPGTYILADGAAGFNTSVTVKTTEGKEFGTLSVGETKTFGSADYTFLKNDGTLSLVINASSENPTGLSGNSSKISWNGTSVAGYTAAYTVDSYKHSLQIATKHTAVDTCGMASGTYGWKVKNTDSAVWISGNAITSEKAETSQLLKSNADGNGDIFFASGSEVWENGYLAQHTGMTGEYAALSGKNKIIDVFQGSTDANLLVMTDDANGDALFVDDIYSAFPAEQQARLAQIDEIRAGAGDDIVDLTSQQFTYSGDGLTIRGGAGNDTIWANSGNNQLFGDAGDDRLVGASGNDVLVGGIGNDSMHGGGGNDIFCFCDNFGTDTVEQLAAGTVTLWFASQKGTWNSSTLTYSDGTNSVKVSGIAADKITLKYGDDGSDQFDALTAAGAFLEISSEKIFEEENKGIIACL